MSRDVGWSKRELSGLVSTLQLCREATEGKVSTLPTEKDYFNFAESKREAEESKPEAERPSIQAGVQLNACQHTDTYTQATTTRAWPKRGQGCGWRHQLEGDRRRGGGGWGRRSEERKKKKSTSYQEYEEDA